MGTSLQGVQRCASASIRLGRAQYLVLFRWNFHWLKSAPATVELSLVTFLLVMFENARTSIELCLGPSSLLCPRRSRAI
jgi:hypothetical protein